MINMGIWFGLVWLMWFFPFKQQVTCLPEMGAEEIISAL